MSGKKKGRKGTKMNLTEFLGDDSVGSLVKPKPKVPDENEEEDTEYYARPKREVNITALPTAPRSSRGVDIDMSKIPNEPPFTVYLGNIPFDATEKEIETFFAGMNITVRIPEGKAKGHAYADFEDRNTFIEALQLDGNTLRNRALNIAIAGQNSTRQGDERRNEGRRDDVDSVADNSNNWRSARSSSGDRGGGGGYQDRSDDRGGFGDRDRGGFGDRDRGGFGDRDRGDGGRRGYGSSYNNNRDYERSSEDDWGRGRKSEVRDEAPRERPKLNITPRTAAPAEAQPAVYSNRPSPFGDARPVEVKVSDDKMPSRREDPVGSNERSSSRPDPFGGARPVDTSQSIARSVKPNPFGDARPVDSKREEPIGASDNVNRTSPFGHSESTNSMKSAVERDSSGRPRLNILPRTIPAGSESNQPQSSSIFGEAKPVDTIQKELAIEKKLTEYNQESSIVRGIANKENLHESNVQPRSPWGRPHQPVENKSVIKKEKIERPLPQSIDEMPKYEVPSEKSWAARLAN